MKKKLMNTLKHWYYPLNDGSDILFFKSTFFDFVSISIKNMMDTKIITKFGVDFE